MAELTRDSLDSFFRTGFKPTQQNFEDVFDSMINIVDDHIDPVTEGAETYLQVGFGGTNTLTPPRPRLSVNGGIRLAESTGIGVAGPEMEGTLIYDGAQLQLHDGAMFNPVGAGGGGAGPWTETILGTESTAEYESLEITVDSVDGSVDFNANTASAPLTFSSGGNPRITVTGGGQVQIGSLLIANQLVLPNGETISGGTGPVINSDERLKQNIRPFDDGLELLKQVNPVRFKYKEGVFGGPSEERIGVIAQQLREPFPYLVKEQSSENLKVNTNNGTYLSVDPAPLTYILINAVKSLSKQVEDLQNRLEILEKANKLILENG